MLSLVPLSAAYPYPFPPPATSKRANTLLLKNRLRDLLSAEQGEVYWQLLCDLLTGKCSRLEFDIGWHEHFVKPVEGRVDGDKLLTRLETLHNCLLLSILYNTTRPTLAPTSVSHQGWSSKRKRSDGLTSLLGPEDGVDPLGEVATKRRRLKRLVGGMTRTEKKRIRALLTQSRNEQGGSTDGTTDKSRLAVMGLPTPIRTPNTAFQQEIQRVAAIPTCVETQELPAVPTLHDRMSSLAYTLNVSRGVDDDVAMLANVALDTYLKNILAALVESTRSVSYHEDSQPIDKQGSSRITTLTSSRRPPTPIGRDQVLALFEMSPGLLHSAHLASVERFYAHQYLYDVPSKEAQLEARRSAQISMHEHRVAYKERAKEEKTRLRLLATRKREQEAAYKLDSNREGLEAASHSTHRGAGGLDNSTNAVSSPLRKTAAVVNKDENGSNASRSGKQASGPTIDLEASLFPELAATATSASTTAATNNENIKAHPVTGMTNSVKKKDGARRKMCLRESDDDGGNTSAEEDGSAQVSKAIEERNATLAAIDNALTLPGLSEKQDAKERTAQLDREREDRGRFGLFQLLSGLLDSRQKRTFL